MYSNIPRSNPTDYTRTITISSVMIWIRVTFITTLLILDYQTFHAPLDASLHGSDLMLHYVCHLNVVTSVQPLNQNQNWIATDQCTSHIAGGLLPQTELHQQIKQCLQHWISCPQDTMWSVYDHATDSPLMLHQESHLDINWGCKPSAWEQQGLSPSQREACL